MASADFDYMRPMLSASSYQAHTAAPKRVMRYLRYRGLIAVALVIAVISVISAFAAPSKAFGLGVFGTRVAVAGSRAHIEFSTSTPYLSCLLSRVRPAPARLAETVPDTASTEWSWRLPSSTATSTWRLVVACGRAHGAFTLRIRARASASSGLDRGRTSPGLRPLSVRVRNYGRPFDLGPGWQRIERIVIDFDHGHEHERCPESGSARAREHTTPWQRRLHA